ncbi:hypothetical protein BCM02_10940 [Paenibacillus methanolicus]|uniref:Uncharacterized protein n=2 Tax=Paenibacillus methanolicus TaxID=582686 RepID=A0A5S5BZZ1_9BACL|nr:hypothetical protein BCM02_10940 [Paenibacillus methanolicus]
MTCEYNAGLCFIRPAGWGGRVLIDDVEALARKLFAGASIEIETSLEDGLDVAVVRANGLAAWRSEAELMDWLDDKLPESWWIWLAGIKAAVIPKADYGPCRLKKRTPGEGRTPAERRAQI